MKIAVIPARGGSKRIPRKNIKNFSGKPMIAWSIGAAKQSGLFEHVIVSTDDEEIAEVATLSGAEVPFLRPVELANDFVGTAAVTKHALEWVMSQYGMVAYVCTLYATAPFVRAQDLRDGWEQMQKSGKGIAFSATSFPYPIQRAFRITAGGGVEMIQPEHLKSRSQDLEPAYHDAGQFYWVRSDLAMAQQTVFCEQAFPIILPRHQVQDIDTIEDWVRAEMMFEYWQKSEHSSAPM